jgi:ribosomal protein S18 acetylase RimI-like enzyme
MWVISAGSLAENAGNRMTAEIRLADPGDVEALFHVRTSVQENHISRERLAELEITDTSVSEMISASPCAWVAVLNEEIVGFSMIDVAHASLFAAFILPAHEGKGLGTELVLIAESELFKRHSEIWLETDRYSRAAGFYRHLGWGNEREAKGNQIRLTKARP